MKTCLPDLNNGTEKDALIVCIEVAAGSTNMSTERALAVLTFLFEEVQRNTSTSNARFMRLDRDTRWETTC
ncbi:MAG: hypothetical protein ACI9HE_002399 [Planctomycetota bacterium]